jgi:hypothetical protein
VRREGLGKFKNSPHRVSNPRPSGLGMSVNFLTGHRAMRSFCDRNSNIIDPESRATSPIRLKFQTYAMFYRVSGGPLMGCDERVFLS